jgi:hypothetical protein
MPCRDRRLAQHHHAFGRRLHHLQNRSFSVPQFLGTFCVAVGSEVMRFALSVTAYASLITQASAVPAIFDSDPHWIVLNSHGMSVDYPAGIFTLDEGPALKTKDVWLFGPSKYIGYQGLSPDDYGPA